MDLDQRCWLYVPSEFPSDQPAARDDWVQTSLSRFAEANVDAGDEEIELARALIVGAQDDVAGAAEFGIQFWPVKAPIALLFLVLVAEHSEGDPLEVLFDGLYTPITPSVDEFHVPGARSARIVNVLVAKTPDAQRVDLAVTGAIIEFDELTVLVRSAVVGSTMIGIAMEPLRAALSTLQVIP